MTLKCRAPSLYDGLRPALYRHTRLILVVAHYIGWIPIHLHLLLLANKVLPVPRVFLDTFLGALKCEGGAPLCHYASKY